MNKHIILNIAKKRNEFTGLYKIIEEEPDIYSAIIKNRNRAIKALLKVLPEERIIISKDSENRKLLYDKLLLYNEVSLDNMLVVINKAVRQLVSNHGLGFPLREIYIFAPPEISCALISRIHETSRLFTVVSPIEVPFNYFDELYFKYGVIVRHKERLLSLPLTETILIEYDNDITLSSLFKGKRDTVSLQEISVLDKQMKEIVKLFRGNVGLSMYTLLGITPNGDITADINRKPDRIFLLDRKRF